MEPKTLTSMTPSEQQLKNRLLAADNGGTLPTGSSAYSSTDPYSLLDSMNTYEPQTIMDRYSSARKLTTESAANTAKKIESEYSTAKEDINIADTKDLTSTLEGQTGFAQMPVALNYMQMSHDKRIRDLTKQKNELLLSNDVEKAKTLSDLILKEETAISDARTKFLTNYFNIAKEKREAAGFQTPDQKAVQELQASAPDAGITSTDTYDEAIKKYKNSRTYKLNIDTAEANLRKINADIAKSYADSTGSPTGTPYNGEFAATINLVSQMGSTNDQRKQIKANLQNFIANKDYSSAYTQVLQATRNGLKGETATRFDNQLNNIEVLNNLEKAIQAYKDAGGNTNIFKGSADKIQTKIGTLMTDPRYASLAVQLNAAFQDYRLKMTGAAFGPQESAEYASILPSAGNTLDLNLAKIKGARNYFDGSISGYIKNVVGEGGVHIKDYAQMPATQSAPAGQKTLSAPTFEGFKLKF